MGQYPEAAWAGVWRDRWAGGGGEAAGNDRTLGRHGCWTETPPRTSVSPKPGPEAGPCYKRLTGYEWVLCCSSGGGGADEDGGGDFPRVARWYHIAALGLTTRWGGVKRPTVTADNRPEDGCRGLGVKSDLYVARPRPLSAGRAPRSSRLELTDRIGRQAAHGPCLSETSVSNGRPPVMTCGLLCVCVGMMMMAARRGARCGGTTPTPPGSSRAP